MPDAWRSLRLVCEHKRARGGEHAADAVRNADLDVRHLSGGLTAELPHRLLNCKHAIHPRVGVGQPATIRIQRQLGSRRRSSFGDECSRLPALDKAEVLQTVDWQMRK